MVIDGGEKMLTKRDAVKWCRDHYEEAVNHPSPSVAVPLAVLMYKTDRQERYLRDYKDHFRQAMRKGRPGTNFVHLITDEYLDMKMHLTSEERKEFERYFLRLALEGIEEGFFDNQVTSLGAISALVKILQDSDLPTNPDLAKLIRELVDLRERNRSWGGPLACWRNGNDDNGIHLGLFMWSVCAWGQYSEPDYFGSPAWRTFWDWMLAQWPPSGMTPLYGDGHGHQRRYGDVDAFFMPLQSLRDGRLKWLADKVFQYWDERRGRLGPRPGTEGKDIFASTNIYRIWKRIDDDLEPRQPDIGCVCLYSPGTERLGMMALSPSTLNRPDKIVFRDGWRPDALYAMLDLRGMTSHDHDDLNGITTITYGEPFVVETKRYSPNRLYHNAFMVAEGEHKDLFSIENGIPPSNCYVDVDYFRDLPRATLSRTSNYFGRPFPVLFEHHRSCLFVKNGYLAVFDNAVSHRRQRYTLGVNWHIIGERIGHDGCISFTRSGKEMCLLLPRGQNELAERPSQWNLSNNAEDITRWWGFDSHVYGAEGTLVDARPPISHLQLVSRGKFHVGEGWGTLAVFHPIRGRSSVRALDVDVCGESGLSAYPFALAAEIRAETHDLIGCATGERTDPYAYEDRGLQDYGWLKTDASLFLCRRLADRMEITYEGARQFRIPLERKPVRVLLSGYDLTEGQGRRDRWTYADDTLRFDRFIRRYGQLDIYTG